MNNPGDRGADPGKTEAMERLLQEKRSELRELRQALPAHSVRPHQLIEIEDLEEAIAELEGRLAEEAGAADQGS